MPVESDRIKGEVAIVTGSAQGIGRGVALKLGRNGAIVYAADINDKGNQETVDLLKAEGFQQAYPVHLDITDPVAVKDGLKAIYDKAGKIDILINCAVLIRFSPIEVCSDEEWASVMKAGIDGPFYLLREIHPFMKASGGGKIVFFSSSSAKSGSSFGGPHYTASKGAVMSLAKYAAKRWVTDNIRVNTICPGITDTPLGRHPEAPRSLEDFVKDIPMGRVGVPEDMAGVVMFLVTDESRYMTGITLDVNGGRYIYGN